MATVVPGPSYSTGGTKQYTWQFLNATDPLVVTWLKNRVVLSFSAVYTNGGTGNAPACTYDNLAGTLTITGLTVNAGGYFTVTTN